MSPTVTKRIWTSLRTSLPDLGYTYAYEPILLNAVVILLVTIVFNGLFRWRRYPAHLHVRENSKKGTIVCDLQIAVMGGDANNHAASTPSTKVHVLI